MRKEKQINGIHTQSIVRPRLPHLLLILILFPYFLMHICLLIIIFSSFFFSLFLIYVYIERQSINAEDILYCILMVKTPTILFVELSSRGINQSERNRCYPFPICVGEKRREKKKKLG